MARWIRESMGALLGMGLVAALGAGCSAPAGSAGRGEIELVVEPATATYDVVGRFRLTGLGAGTLDRDVVFDGTRSRGSVALPAGHYALTLQPGASLHCAGGDRDSSDALDTAVSTPARLVSAPPRLVTIATGERLTARITLDAEPTARGTSEETPCAPLAVTVLSRR
jgi:hypothetical protein